MFVLRMATKKLYVSHLAYIVTFYYVDFDPDHHTWSYPPHQPRLALMDLTEWED